MEQYKANMLAQAMAGVKIRRKRFSGNCYNCGVTGHTRKECRNKNRNGSRLPNTSAPVEPRQPGLCPRCQKGNHWASACRSAFHNAGTQLQGNGSGGGATPGPDNNRCIYTIQAAPQNYQAVHPSQNFQYSN